MTYLLVFLFQVTFNIAKVFEIKLTQENKTLSLMVNSVAINLIGLSSSFVSIDSLFKGDFWIILFYTIGSVVGKWIGMKYYQNPKTIITINKPKKKLKKNNNDLLRFQY